MFVLLLQINVLENMSVRVVSQQPLGIEDTEAVRQCLRSMMHVTRGRQRKLDNLVVEL